MRRISEVQQGFYTFMGARSRSHSKHGIEYLSSTLRALIATCHYDDSLLDRIELSVHPWHILPMRKQKGNWQIPAIARALGHRNFRLFFVGQTVSLIGTWMQRIAVGWLVYRLTDSAFLLGLVGFAGQIPAFFLAPFAGVLADRWNRHRLAEPRFARDFERTSPCAPSSKEIP